MSAFTTLGNANMGTREDFERLSKDIGANMERDKYDYGYTDRGTNGMYRGYLIRQPEIDALKEEIGLCHGTLESRERNIADIKAENERLRKELNDFFNSTKGGIAGKSGDT